MTVECLRVPKAPYATKASCSESRPRMARPQRVNPRVNAGRSGSSPLPHRRRLGYGGCAPASGASRSEAGDSRPLERFPRKGVSDLVEAIKGRRESIEPWRRGGPFVVVGVAASSGRSV